MKTLIVDTTTQHLYCILLTEGEVFNANILRCKNRHSELLATAVKDVLRQANFTFADLDCYAVGVGPGSFTGIRIGVSTVKGLNVAVPKKLIAINNLLLTAYRRGSSAVIDAGNGWYYQQFSGISPTTPPQLLAYDDERSEGAVYFDAEKDYTDDLVALVRELYASEQFAATLTPCYIRKSQAEVNSGR
jgi:tRNA threonylcarbamoyl adenosine modification protein YeaZ